MATALSTLPDFLVTVDVAQHTVIDQVDSDGNTVRTIDFGIFGEVADVMNAWLDLDSDEARDSLAPALNVYLLAQFTKVPALNVYLLPQFTKAARS